MWEFNKDNFLVDYIANLHIAFGFELENKKYRFLNDKISSSLKS